MLRCQLTDRSAGSEHRACRPSNATALGCARPMAQSPVGSTARQAELALA